MKAGEFDVIDSLFFTEERARFLDFSEPYATIDATIFFSEYFRNFKCLFS